MGNRIKHFLDIGVLNIKKELVFLWKFTVSKNTHLSLTLNEFITSLIAKTVEFELRHDLMEQV
jgi:hypothetical protein